MAAPVSLTGVVKTLGLQVWCNVSSSQNQCVLQLGFGHRFIWFRFCTLFYCIVIGIAAAAAVTSVVFDSVRPHRRQPTKLRRPWDSPGKNTGVGCHFLFQCIKVKSESEVAQSCPTLSNPMDHSLPGSSVHGIFQALVISKFFSNSQEGKHKNLRNKVQIK